MSSHVNVEADGTYRDVVTGDFCKPPAPIYFISGGWEGSLRGEVNLSGLRLDEQSLDALIDTFVFFKQRGMSIFAE